MENKSRLSLPCLLMAQAQVAFNDNAARFMLVGLAQAVLPADRAALVISSLAVILILPFVFMAPLVGWIADRFPKQKVLHAAMVLQIGVMLWIVAAIASRQLMLAVAGFALLSIQSCIFSPAKQGILKELVGAERLGSAAGLMGGLSILSVLLGMVSGGLLFDRLAKETGDPWQGALQATWIFTAGAVAAWLIFLGIRRTESQTSEPFTSKILVSHFAYIADLWREKPLRLAALGIAFFWAFGGVINLSVIQIGRDLNQGQIGSVSISVLLLFVIGAGMAAGSVVAAVFCRKRIELGLVPVGAVGLMASILAAGVVPMDSPVFRPSLFALGFFAGIFTVPLNAYLQARAEDARRGRVLAALTLLVDTGGLAAIALQYALGEVLGLSAPQQFLVMVLPSLAVAGYVLWLLPESLLRLSTMLIAKCVYRVKARGAENIPAQGGVLLIANHVTYVDAVILQLVCPRPIRFVAYETLHRNFWIGWAVKILGVIPISPRHAKDAVRAVAELLKRGEAVCIFPEGQLTRTGTLQGLRKGFELMARQGEAPVLPVFLDSLWGSIFSYADRRYFWKIPRQWPYVARVVFGKPIPPDQARAVDAWRTLLDLGEEAFELRPELERHLGLASIQALGSSPWRAFLVDRTSGRRTLSRGEVLAAALALSQRWKRSLQGGRVGVVLPPGAGGLIANLALVLAGKIPVNLNFTAGRAAIESCLRRAEIETIISAGILQKKLTDFPWPAHTIDVAREMAVCGKPAMAGWLAAVWMLPSGWIASLAGAPRTGGRNEAALLFTSGSSGEPKGVVLSHRNILGNVTQFAATNLIDRHDTLLGCLPLFHSFGFTATLWYPVLRGVPITTLPSPLESRNVGAAVSEEKVTVLMATPTFLRAYLRKIDAREFASLRMAVAGAEKMPADLGRAFVEKFHVPVMEGYGLTETSPVVSANVPDPGREVNPGTRTGSVGRLMPGLTARIVDPETGEPRSLLETGMLWLRGPNIFSGYLGDEAKTRQVLHDGWFITGDLARFDEDGFLFIEGRLSRFSKIGGEMVPHGTVEEAVARALGMGDGDAPAVAVVGIPDEAKGEALVLLTCADLAADSLREKLAAAGLPNLWIPRIIRRVDKLPMLSTGKLDLKGCEALARKSPPT